jgi:hypothetical protein
VSVGSELGFVRPPAAAPESSLRWPAGSPMIRAAGNRSRGRPGSIRLCQVVPCPVSRCGQCRWVHSCLRVVPGQGRGRMGRARVRGGQAGSIRGTPCRLAAGGRVVCGLAPDRGHNAWPGPAAGLAGGAHAAPAVRAAGGCGRQRIWPSRIRTYAHTPYCGPN